MSFTLSIGPRVRKSCFFDATVADGVKSFSVYNHMFMPTSYGDPDAEYDRLINGVAMWDVAVERQVELAGRDAGVLAAYLVPRRIGAQKVGQGYYVPLCDHSGRLINDPILMKLADDRYWLSIADHDIVSWAHAIAAERGLDVSVHEPDVSPLAVQGPKAEDVVASLLGNWVRDLRYFWFRECDLDGIPLVVCRSGWSKQGGFELFLRDGSRGLDLWDRVRQAGKPFGIGPGTPNYTERVESALISYRADTDDCTDPFEMGLGKYVHLDREDDFVGKAALAAIAARGQQRRFKGLFIDGDRLSPNQEHWPCEADGRPAGKCCVVAWSPRLGRNIAVAMLPVGLEDGAEVTVATRHDGPRRATVTSLPFV